MKKLLNEREEEILNFIKLDPKYCLDLGIVKLSQLHYTSTSSIVRLAKKVGYKGYKDLVYSFRANNYSVKPCVFNNRLFEVRSKSEINKFLNIIKKNKVIVFGENFSGIVGQYISNRLFTLGIDSYFINCIDYKLFFKSFGKNYNSIILVSNTGYSEKCLEIIRLSKEYNNKYDIISFTGSSKNEILSSSDVAFIIEGISSEDLIIKYPNPFYGNTILGFEELMLKFIEKNRLK